MAVCNILPEDYFDPFETCDACQGTGDAGADRDCRVCGGRGWRDDAPFPDEQRAAVMDMPPAHVARIEFESTGMIVESDLPGGLYDPEADRAFSAAHEPQEAQS